MQPYLAHSEQVLDSRFNPNHRDIVDFSNEDPMATSESSYETLVKFKNLIDIVYMKPKEPHNNILDNSKFQTVYQTDGLSEGHSDEFWDITLVNMLLSVYKKSSMDTVTMLALSRYIDKAYGRDTMKMIREHIVL